MLDITSWKEAKTPSEAVIQNDETITKQIRHIEGQMLEMLRQFAELTPRQKRYWGYPGNQGYVMERLNEIIEFLG